MAKRPAPKRAKAATRRSRTERPARKRASGRQPQPSAASPGGAGRARVRVYRHGLGDCILVRIPRKRGEDFKLLIDCGVAVATQGAADEMTRVVENVVAETKGEVDVLAITHQHWDHVSGFAQAEKAFAKLRVGEVWVAWTEDEEDPLAKSLRNDHAKALAVLGASAQAMALSGRSDRADAIDDMVGLCGLAGDKTAKAFKQAMAMGKDRPEPRYWQPDQAHSSARQQTEPLKMGDPDITIYALGPPYDAKLIRKTLPSTRDPETYELKIDGGTFPPSVMSALLDPEDTMPFSPTVTIPMERARAMPFFQENYWNTSGGVANWRGIDVDWLGAAEDLALAMQSATNNTSLVLAIECPGGDVLLFAGDAQVGNWLSWQQRTWTVGGRTVTGPDLLARTVFYKVGHHGSHNATLREKGLDMMKALNTAVIPVDQEVAKKMRWGAMPLTALVAALNERTNGRTLRTDMAPQAPIPGVQVEDLYYEVSL